uniref:Uncharacterized protein n=1 Tax=Anguilla anguilla TaxID=7936 RepID=A0A0E9V808_ANGAN
MPCFLCCFFSLVSMLKL